MIKFWECPPPLPFLPESSVFHFFIKQPMNIKLYRTLRIPAFMYVLTWSLILRKNTDWWRLTIG